MFDKDPSASKHLENEYGEVISPTQHLLDKPILNGHELLNLPTEDDNYLVDKLLWENQVIFLTAAEKVGKTIFSLQLACALSCGDRFLGEFEVSHPLKILYIQAEGNRQETISWLKRMTNEQGVKWNPDNFYHMFPSALALDTEEGKKDLIMKIKATGFAPDVVQLDPLYMTMIGDLSDNQRARMFCRCIRELQEMYRCSIIVNHHEHRGIKDKNTGRYINEGDKSIMGSFVWSAFASHLIRLQIKKDKTRVMTCDTQRSGKVLPELPLKLVSGPSLYFQPINEGDNKPDQILRLFVSSKSEPTYFDLENLSGLSKNTVSKSVATLLDDSKIDYVNKGKRPLRFKLKERQDE